MEVSKYQYYYVSFNLEDDGGCKYSDEKVPYIEPYVIQGGAFKGQTVRDLVKQGIPGLKALVKVMNAYHVHEFDCANSIVYELVLKAQNILDKCDVEDYPEYLCTLRELLGTMPEQGKICDLYLHCDDEDEDVRTLYDMAVYDDPEDCEEVLRVIVHDITTSPMFVYLTEMEDMDERDKIDGTCGVVPGMKVAIVLKKNQGTDKLDEGIVHEVLTKSMFHPRGIKVRLTDGKIGRVQKIFC